MTKKHNPRTTRLVPNDNKTFSVGIPIVVDSYFHNLGFEEVFGPLKSKGVDINSLARLLVTCRKKDSIEIKSVRCNLSELAGASAKFIKKSLRNLTETLVWGENDAKKRIFSNFDRMSEAILRKCVNRQMTVPAK